MKYIVTDKIGHGMDVETKEQLKLIEPETNEELMPFEDKPIVCYIQGTVKVCQDFVNKQTDNIQECLEIKNINDLE